MASSSPHVPEVPSSSLPRGQLESARFKVIQLMESIQSLQRVLEAGGQNVMPSWPDILTKYNVLLSQTHNLSNSLIAQGSSASSSKATPAGAALALATANPLERLALVPSAVLTETQFDNDVVPLLRNIQTIEVLRLETDVVRRLGERLPSAAMLKDRPTASETHSAVIQDCERIRTEHDSRCERAVRAVALLREKYDWKARVAVETEEPEDFPMSPILALSPMNRMSPIPPLASGDGDDDVLMGTPGGGADDDDDDDSGNDEAELEEVLGPSLQPTPGDSP
ncbi:hypothetical protein SCHPADRAFT_424208 [Schizopora paradoxa]|uniref:Mediator complex subunit 8 n=1 Tax=Schizopora paradoxa TaxID=27342 RepID=A0A0H2S5X2_9AGAM|nr:hypothetical protein SCHPADRAFT_424208 [Schizopora paradoxa]